MKQCYNAKPTFVTQWIISVLANWPISAYICHAADVCAGCWSSILWLPITTRPTHKVTAKWATNSDCYWFFCFYKLPPICSSGHLRRGQLRKHVTMNRNSNRCLKTQLDSIQNRLQEMQLCYLSGRVVQSNALPLMGLWHHHGIMEWLQLVCLAAWTRQSASAQGILWYCLGVLNIRLLVWEFVNNTVMLSE